MLNKVAQDLRDKIVVIETETAVVKLSFKEYDLNTHREIQVSKGKKLNIPLYGESTLLFSVVEIILKEKLNGCKV